MQVLQRELPPLEELLGAEHDFVRTAKNALGRFRCNPHPTARGSAAPLLLEARLLGFRPCLSRMVNYRTEGKPCGMPPCFTASQVFHNSRNRKTARAALTTQHVVVKLTPPRSDARTFRLPALISDLQLSLGTLVCHAHLAV